MAPEVNSQPRLTPQQQESAKERFEREELKHGVTLQDIQAMEKAMKPEDWQKLFNYQQTHAEDNAWHLPKPKPPTGTDLLDRGNIGPRVENPIPCYRSADSVERYLSQGNIQHQSEQAWEKQHQGYVAVGATNEGQQRCVTYEDAQGHYMIRSVAGGGKELEMQFNSKQDMENFQKDPEHHHPNGAKVNQFDSTSGQWTEHDVDPSKVSYQKGQGLSEIAQQPGSPAEKPQTTGSVPERPQAVPANTEVYHAQAPVYPNFNGVSDHPNYARNYNAAMDVNYATKYDRIDSTNNIAQESQHMLDDIVMTMKTRGITNPADQREFLQSLASVSKDGTKGSVHYSLSPNGDLIATFDDSKEEVHISQADLQRRVQLATDQDVARFNQTKARREQQQIDDLNSYYSLPNQRPITNQ